MHTWLSVSSALQTSHKASRTRARFDTSFPMKPVLMWKISSRIALIFSWSAVTTGVSVTRHNSNLVLHRFLPDTYSCRSCPRGCTPRHASRPSSSATALGTRRAREPSAAQRYDVGLSAHLRLYLAKHGDWRFSYCVDAHLGVPEQLHLLPQLHVSTSEENR